MNHRDEPQSHRTDEEEARCPGWILSSDATGLQKSVTELLDALAEQESPELEQLARSLEAEPEMMVQRCDTCARFADDDAAREHVLALAQKAEAFMGYEVSC